MVGIDSKNSSNASGPSVVELCSGGGGQAIGLERAGFHHLALVDNDLHCCATLRHNRPDWNVIATDVQSLDGSEFSGLDLLAAGLPCPPFSIAGQKLGKSDERDLFPAALRLITEIRPKAVMIENVKGILQRSFDPYRHEISKKLRKLGYKSEWKLLNASHFGVPQLRPRAVLVALLGDLFPLFSWPDSGESSLPPTVGETLYPMMSSKGWLGASEWRDRARSVAPTIVGGSLKHGGPDLGPVRAKKAWLELGVDAHVIGNEVPGPEFDGNPRLTVEMVATLQGFPISWQFVGSKTAKYRQIANAFPPPVAHAVAIKIARCLK